MRPLSHLTAAADLPGGLLVPAKIQFVIFYFIYTNR